MNTTGIATVPQTIEFEGYSYLELNGHFYKGCKRCGGTGHYSFDGFSSDCYECGNSAYGKLGTELASREAAEKWCHVRRLAKENRDRKREAEVQAKHDRMVANQLHLMGNAPDVYTFLMGIVIEDDTQSLYDTYEAWAATQVGPAPVKLEKNGFLRTMAETLRWVGPSKQFTPKMIAAVEKAMLDRQTKAAADAAKPALIEGRRIVTGKVISTKAVDGEYGTTYKMLVEEETGQRVYGTIAGSLWDDVEFLGSYRKLAWDETEGVMRKLVGMEVTFTATVEVSKDDKSFGFFKRPTKATIVA